MWGEPRYNSSSWHFQWSATHDAILSWIVDYVYNEVKASTPHPHIQYIILYVLFVTY